MKKNKEWQEYFKGKYYNKNNNYTAIISIISNEKVHHKNKLAKLIKIAEVTGITLISTASIAFASSKIYENIKEQKRVSTDNLYRDEQGYYTNEFVKKNMEYDKQTGIYYKIISNNNDLNSYKEKMSELSEINDIDFNVNYVVIISGVYVDNSSMHRNDLEISSITSDSNSTYISLKQKDNPNYDDKTVLTLYATIDKNILKDNIKFNIETPSMNYSEGVKKLHELPETYSANDAIKDGCFVVDYAQNGYKLLSNNKNNFDEFIKNSKENKESFIRIYRKEIGEIAIIIDISYNKEKEYYIEKARILNNIDDTFPTPDEKISETINNVKIWIFSFKYLTKNKNTENNYYTYCYNNQADNSKIGGGMIATVSYE